MTHHKATIEEVKEFKLLIDDIVSEHNKDLADSIEFINKMKKELRDMCPHDWTYHPDPSGNNDSYYTCSLCDYNRKKFT